MFKMSLWRELQWNVGKKVMMKLQSFGVSLSHSPGILVWPLLTWGSMVAPRGYPLPLLNKRVVGKSFLIFPQYMLLCRFHL